MSVLIKGMEMPTTCRDCRLSTFTDFDSMPFCNITMNDIRINDWETKRCDNCPLIELPPHGRLIDADAINHEDEIWKKKCIPPQVVYNAWAVAGEMPTVIPADKDGEI